jgi:hypothetical protein
MVEGGWKNHNGGEDMGRRRRMGNGGRKKWGKENEGQRMREENER